MKVLTYVVGWLYIGEIFVCIITPVYSVAPVQGYTWMMYIRKLKNKMENVMIHNRKRLILIDTTVTPPVYLKQLIHSGMLEPAIYNTHIRNSCKLGRKTWEDFVFMTVARGISH